MKKLYVIFLAAILIFAEGSKVCGMQSQQVEDSWNFLLKNQNYRDLGAQLKQAYDSSDDGEQKRAQNWASSHVVVKHEKQYLREPFLLYMEARTILKHAKHVDVLPKAYKYLMLFIVLTAVAESVVAKHGAGVKGLSVYFKNKFIAEYLNGPLRSSFRSDEKLKFEVIKAVVTEELTALKNDDSAIRVLPLPHWVKWTSSPRIYGWGVNWGALPVEEIEIRNDDDTMDAIVKQTKKALDVEINKLSELESWEAFFDTPESVNAVVLGTSQGVPHPGVLNNIFKATAFYVPSLRSLYASYGLQKERADVDLQETGDDSSEEEEE